MTDWRTEKVLDHGFVHLLDSMPSVWDKNFGQLGPGDVRVVQAARVSTAHLPDPIRESIGIPKPELENREPEQDVRLIHYLMKNRHTSPFEKVRFEFIVRLPIFVARQWIRHRMGSFNEVSARYSQLPEQFYVPELSRMQAQSKSNKQVSAEVLPEHVAEDCRTNIDSLSIDAYETYEYLLDKGLARELARMVLPVNFYTQWYWTVDLHNLFHFLRLRIHAHAQYEIRMYAEAILRMVEHVCPVSVTAFRQVEHTWLMTNQT